MSQSIAAKSVAEFPLLPTWLGIQIKTTFLSSLVNYTCSSKIFTLEPARERERERRTCQNSVSIIPQNKREK